MRTIENSLICVNQAGAVGIVGEVLPGDVCTFFAFDAEGNTGAGATVEVATLKQATQDQIPASRRLPDAQAIELGYLDPPPSKYVRTTPDRFERVE